MLNHASTPGSLAFEHMGVNNLVLLILLAVAQTPGVLSSAPSAIRYVDKPYRVYQGGGTDQVWRDGYDRLTKHGFKMVPVNGGQLDAAASSIDTPYGRLQISSDPPLFKKDFHISYAIPTPWPYCKSLSECLVYSQVAAPRSGAPITLTLPPGVSAVDFYLDAGIDCVTTLKAYVACKVRLQPGDVEVRGGLHSICDSPFVGRYFGFYDSEGGNITSVRIKCKSTFPNVVGLLRIGSQAGAQKRQQQGQQQQEKRNKHGPAVAPC